MSATMSVNVSAPWRDGVETHTVPGKSGGKLCIKFMHYRAAAFQRWRNAFQWGKLKDISLSAGYCTMLSAEKENEELEGGGGWDRKEEMFIRKKGEGRVESERNAIFPLRVSGLLLCDMSVSVGTSCLSLHISSFFFYPSHHPLLLHPLLFCSMSPSSTTLVAVQPCHFFFLFFLLFLTQIPPPPPCQTQTHTLSTYPVSIVNVI